MSMHTIEVVYDPTTRRISLTQNTDKYGGATSDNNSVEIVVEGIPDYYDGGSEEEQLLKGVSPAPEPGEEEEEDISFRARIDFNVQVMTDAHTYQHPYVELEPYDMPVPVRGTVWHGIIPGAVLAATEHTGHKLQFQLFMTGTTDGRKWAVNSRNSITLEVTQAIAAQSDELPMPELPDWEIPEYQDPFYEDIHVVEVTYNVYSRMLTLNNEKSKYGGSTIDTNSVAIVIGFDYSDPYSDFSGGYIDDSSVIKSAKKGDTKASYNYYDYRARLDFAVPVMVEEGIAVKPFVPLIDPNYSGGGGEEQERSVKSLSGQPDIQGYMFAIIPQPVLMSAKETKKLPFQLVIRQGDIVECSRNTIVLEVTRAINAMHSISKAYAPYVMFRDDSWGWLENFTYSEGAVVTYEGEVYVSLVNDNKGNNPAEDDGTYWHSLEQNAPTFYSADSWEEYDELEAIAKVGDFLRVYINDPDGLTDETYILAEEDGWRGWMCLSSTNLNGYKYTSFPSFYAPEDSGESNQMLVSQGEGASPIWKKLSRSFYANFRNRDTYEIPMYGIEPWVDLYGCNFHCNFYDNYTNEQVVLPYKVTKSGSGSNTRYTITVTCKIKTQIRMDVFSMPSLGGVY